MSNQKQFFTAQTVAVLAILTAMIVVLQFFASAVPMFGVTLNFSLIPIALAAIYLGKFGGAILGFISGSITFVVAAVMGGEPFTAYLFSASPVLLTLTCIGKTTAAGFIAGLLYELICGKSRLAASYVASFCIPFINTGIYVLGMVSMTGDVAAFFELEAGAGVVFTFVWSVIWLNFLLEIATTILLSPAVFTVTNVVRKQLQK